MTAPLTVDLDEVLDQTRHLWDDLKGERLFVTGGTGFFGRWLLESLAWAERRLNLGVEAVVLTRDPARFQRAAPHLAVVPWLALVAGDVRDFAFPAGAFSYVIHAATDTGSSAGPLQPQAVFDTVVHGTRGAIALAERCGTRRLLFTSSGAVYGRQPSDLAHVPEEFTGGPDLHAASSAYAEGKRAAETLCAMAGGSGLEIVIARGFAFLGPWLPLDRHFAAGNFIRDALSGGPIRIQGDGTPFRSYLYGSDLSVWLWTILFRGQPLRPYNVGSEEAVTVTELAHRIASSMEPPVGVERARTPVADHAPERYVPCVARARNELGLTQTVDLDTAIRRTLAWHRQEREMGANA